MPMLYCFPCTNMRGTTAIYSSTCTCSSSVHEQRTSTPLLAAQMVQRPVHHGGTTTHWSFSTAGSLPVPHWTVHIATQLKNQQSTWCYTAQLTTRLRGISGPTSATKVTRNVCGASWRIRAVTCPPTKNDRYRGVKVNRVWRQGGHREPRGWKYHSWVQGQSPGGGPAQKPNIQTQSATKCTVQAVYNAEN